MAIHATQKEVEEFERLLGQAGAGEGPIQAFLEMHSEFVPTPFVLGHNVNLGVIISKFQIDTNLVTDFTYITKNSAKWQVVFIEIEDPEAQSSAKPRRNVIGHVGDGYCFKAFRAAPGTLFSWVNVKYFRLTQSEQDLLINAGLDMPSWLAGKDLSVNGAKPKFSFSDPSAFQVSQAVEKLLYP